MTSQTFHPPVKGETWRHVKDGDLCRIVTAWNAGVVVRWPGTARQHRALYTVGEFRQAFAPVSRDLFAEQRVGAPA